MNECGISKEGFEELKKALLERANLANTQNLTHVKMIKMTKITGKHTAMTLK